MTTKKVLLALAATRLLTLGSVAPVQAEEPPTPSDEGTTKDVPAEPDSAESGDVAPDPGTDDGAGDNSGDGSGSEGGEPPPQPE
jgi:hypothetical protein